ncbi:MAG TPA: HAMP domain-containing sensor histidine kinase [Deltaproteobacteria bacterium]|nr:HAMP domain-containing sensor histidine kinase [Deltaproteobacteria bacterium]
MRPFGSIRFRIVAAFLAAMTTMLSAVVLLMVQYQGVSRSQAMITEGYLPLDIRVDQISADQERIETDIERLLRGDRRPTTGSTSPATIYSERLLETLQQTQIHARRAKQLTTNPVEVAVLNKAQTHLERIEALSRDWQSRAQQFVLLSEAGNLEGAAAMVEPLHQDGRALGEEIDKLSKLLGRSIQTVTEATDRKRRAANGIAFSLTVLSLVLSLGLIGAVLHALQPIGSLTAQVQRLAEGDYSGHVQVRGGDEIALLAGEFNRMVRALQHRDRTLVQRAEQLNRLSRYLASVLNNLEGGLFVVEGGVVTLANPAAERLWEIRQDAAPNELVRSWIEAPGLHEHRAGRLEFEIRVMPFGESGVIVLTADVTEQRRALEGLARSERLALVGQMLAQITHEVRNPLNAMSLNAEMLSDELDQLDPAHSTEAWDLLATVSGEIERLTEVTAHYLQLARRPPTRMIREDLPALLRDVARLLQAELDQQGVTLELTCAELVPQLVDGNQLRQALLNVVRNAVEAGAHQLQLQLQLASSDDELHITLHDDGPGMSDEEVERAFDPFFSTKASGTGLGLAITRQILEDHGGTIQVVSRPGEGTHLTLVLPVRPAP